MRVGRTLIDANPAGGQPLVNLLKAGHVTPDFVFSPI
jgi:hypothetical protein